MSNSKKALAQKLAKSAGEKVKTLRSPVPDIEECATSSYFSPIQTRRQRSTKSTLAASNKAVEAPLKPKKELKVETLKDDTTPWEPLNWRQMLQNVRKMRENFTAPVDSMGCHKCADANADEKTQRYQKLVALMLSSQTKDETTFDAMQRLKQHGLTPAKLTEIDIPKLEDLLRPVSFYKNKAKYLKQTSQILIDKYDSDIPKTVKDLVSLPGVGPKMAHICMATAWNEVTGIGVDVHVHRIANRLQWVNKPTKEPEQTRIALESWLPNNLWHEVNCLLVGFGQTICTPTRPNCGDCLNSDICPAADKTIAKQKRNAPTSTSPLQALKFQKKKINLQ